MRNIIKSLMIVAGCLAVSTVWAVDPTLAINTESQGSTNFVKAYTAEGITLSSTVNFSSGAVQLGNTPSTYDQHYFEVLASSTTIDSVSFLISGNGSNKSIQAPVFGWTATATSNTADTYRILDAVTVTANSYAAAKWFTYDFSSSAVKCLRLYRSTKNISSTNPAYTGSSTALGSGQTIKIYGLKVWLTPAISTDATLKSLKYNGTDVPGFSSTTYTYNVELPAGTTAIPTVTAEKNDTKASDPVITQATGLPGAATVSVTAEDGTTTLTYTINFTVASSLPKVLTATWPNIQGTAAIDQVNKTITGQVTNGSGLTSITPSFTGNNIDHYTPEGAQDFTAPVNYIFFNANTETTQYTVTITEAPATSTDATLSSLKYGGQSVPNFSASTYAYNVELPAGTTSAPNVTATATESHATMSITQATAVPGTATVLVTAQDGTTKLTYTINFTVQVPPSGLTLHTPGIYEADVLEGGYGGELNVFGSREYEVYYCTYDSSSNLSVAVTPKRKTVGITNSISAYHFKAKDGWFELNTTTSKSDFSLSSDKDEFKKGDFAVHKLLNNKSYKWRVKGYDQFSFFAKENSSNGRYIKVLIDDNVQQMDKSTSATIRRFDIPTGEHVIEIIGVGESNEEVYGFSLRVAQEPRTKYVDGNDSTQEVLQTTAPQAVYYYTKYNSLGETRLEWDGAQGTGFALETVGSSEVGDTLALGGTAQCPVGEYHYFVKTYFNGVETSSVPGKIKVTSLIKPKGATRCEAYQNEAIDDIRFTYYALSGDDITLTWENNKIPAGISGHGANGTYIISGTPTQVDTFVYTISVLGGNSISDTLFVDKLDLGNDPILYLYKNDGAKAKDGTYKYLTSLEGGYKNLIARKAKADGKRSADQYNKYKWILISEDVDANNEEVLAIARGEVALPVLNMKSFTYAPGRLNWGEPDNGSLTQEGRFVTVYRDDHPIFQALNKHKGDRIMVLDTVVGKGLMPIDVDYDNTLCLATALTRNINDYYSDGPERTIMHEVERLNGKKYICFPIGMEGSNHLTTDGKRLLNQTITYLLSSDATIKVPSLAITHFRVGSYDGVIDDENNVITLNVKEEDSELMKAAEPVITLADPMTFVTPNSGEAVNFIDAPYGIRYVVSDYVTKRNYNVIVRLYNPQGIDNIEVGTWLNIFDIYGRKVATTNQDIRTMDLPHGMYIVVTESGQTIKIMR